MIHFFAFLVLVLSGVVPPFGSLEQSSAIEHEPATPTYTQNLELNPLPAQEVHLPHKIVFVGDVMLARDVDRRTRLAGNPDYPFTRILLVDPDAYVVGNFEAAMPHAYKETPHFGFQFAVPSTTAPAIKRAGFTHVSLANNHSLDFGKPGFEETVRYLSIAGIQVAGHSTKMSSSSIVYVDTSVGVVALVMVSVVTSVPSDAILESLLAEASKQSNMQIIYVHWGEEYMRRHTAAQEQLATSLVLWGADLIVGHHPHVVQDIEYIAGVLIVYSLGNFIFDQYFSRDVQQGLVLSVDLEHEKIRLYPVTSADVRVQPRHMTTTESTHFLSELADLSSPYIRSQIKNGVLPLTYWVATSSKEDMIEE